MSPFTDEPVRRRASRPPWLLLGTVIAILVLAVVGNLITGWRGRSEPASTTAPPVDVATLVKRSSLVVIGRAVNVQRQGDPKDPAAVATIAVERWIKGSGDARISVYDKGFTTSWSEGQRAVLFLQPRLGDPRWRVDTRYLFAGAALQAPFDLNELDRVAGVSTTP